VVGRREYQNVRRNSITGGLNMFKDPLSSFAQLIPKNFAAITEEYPKLSQAAEAINQAMTSLLMEDVSIDEEDSKQYSAYLMLFGSHSSWITSYLMSVSGHLDTSWSEIRRSIEFVCYAAKVAGDKRRAMAWIKQRTEISFRKTFISSCSIPLNYTDDKYKYLRQLIIAYDTASYYGSHANLETLGHKYQRMDNGNVKLSYQADFEHSALDAGFIVLLGYRLLEAYRIILNPSLINKNKIDSVAEFVKSSLRTSRLDFASRRFGKQIPYDVMRFVFEDKQEYIDEVFEELIKSEEERKQAKGNVNKPTKED
jgi:hypothetical protein